jgi:exosome complex component RRP42
MIFRKKRWRKLLIKMAELYETSNVTAERIRKYLGEGKRFDGRKLDEFREITIEQGVSKNAEGSVRVKIGNTEVLVGVKLDVTEPYADSPDKGNLMVTAEFLPLSSQRFELGPPKIDSIELGRVIDRIIRESKFIELEKLCIKEGEKVWQVFIDIYSINDDGNLLDAAGIGAIAALKTAKIPKYDEKEGKVVHGEWSSKGIPLAKETPISITMHKIGNAIIVDPTKEEEDVSETRVTIGASEEYISSVQKGGEKSLKMEEINGMIDMSEKLYRKILLKLEKFMK